MNKKYLSLALALVMLAGIATAVPTFADTTPTNPPMGGMMMGGDHMGGRMGSMRGGMGIFGTVSSVNGTTLIVSGKQGFGSTTVATTFTVDASNAAVRKDNATSSVSAITSGDTVMVRGTVSGTNVTATMINDGIMKMGQTGKRPSRGEGTSTSPISGNGEPIVAGTVSSISGSTLTITNKSNVQYTIDASNAKIAEGANTISLSSIAVGDNVVIQGTMNGTSVAASSVIDQKSQNGSTPAGSHGPMGFLGGIGQFFMHLFGF